MAATARSIITLGLVISGIVAATGLPLRANAAITFQVSFNDPGSLYAPYYNRIRSNVISAGNEWASYFGSSYNASVQVQLGFADIATAAGASITNSYVGLSNGLATYEQGAAYEIRTGLDPNGSAPDVRITIGRTGYLQNELWFDPSPNRQSAAVPLNRTDARSVFLHEFGHAFAFNGWRNGQTGALPGGYQSTFDAWVTTRTFEGQPQLFFTGSAARSLYGGPVPLTFGQNSHLGNLEPRPGSILIPDLMNGVSFYRGSRYHVSPLDLAILGDTGFPTTSSGAGIAAAGAPLFAAAPFASAVPEPSTCVLTMGGLIALVWVRRRTPAPAPPRIARRLPHTRPVTPSAGIARTTETARSPRPSARHPATSVRPPWYGMQGTLSPPPTATM